MSEHSVDLDWNEDGTEATGPDGVRYMIQREEIRHEGVWYSALYREPGWLHGRWEHVPIGDVGHRKGPQQTRIRRYAKQRASQSQPDPQPEQCGGGNEQ